MKLQKLTSEQEEKMLEVKKYWLDYIFSCKNSIDKKNAKMGIDWLYNSVKRDSPIIIYLDSPMACQVGANILRDQVWGQVGDQVWAQVWAQVRDQVGAQVGDQVGDQVWAQVRAQVGAQVGGQVGDQVWGQVRDQVWDQVWGQVGDQVWAQVRAQVGGQVGAQVGDQVGDQVWAQVRDQVWAQVGAQVGDQVGAQVGDQVWGQVGAQVRDQVGDQVGDQVRDQVGDQVWAQVGDQVGDQVRDQVWAQVRAQVGDQVWGQVGDQVWAQVGDQVWGQVGDQVGAQVRAQVRAQVGAQKMEFFYFAGYGSVRDYGWVSFYDFFTQIGVVNHEGFNQFKSILESGIYDMIQLNGFCIVSDMPNVILRNSRNRLHCEDGPALKFKDGYSLYYWNGVCVPKHWIETPEVIQKDEIIKESNAEKRRCLREILGSKKYFDLLGGVKVIDEDIDNQGFTMKLYETLKKDDITNSKIQFLEVVCPSTDRTYNIYPPNQKSKNVFEAKASTFGKKQSEFNPSIES